MKPSISQISCQPSYQFHDQVCNQVLRRVRDQVDQIWSQTQGQVNYLMIPDELEKAVDQLFIKSVKLSKFREKREKT